MSAKVLLGDHSLGLARASCALSQPVVCAGPSAQQIVKDASLGVVIFLALTRARPSRLLPSDLSWPGACRDMSMPATTKYANAQQRGVLGAGFRKAGCHSCGARPSAQNCMQRGVTCNA